MKKAFVSILLSVCLAFTFILTACNSNQGGNDPDGNEPVAPAQPTESLTYEKNGDAYTVTGMTGTETAVVIPAEYEGLPVTAIENDAFAYANHTSDILSVTIPDSVVTIGRNAFHNRSELVTVTIGENSALTAINNNAFSGNGSLKEIYLPKGLARLGSEGELGDAGSVFNACGSLDTITVAEGNAVYSSEGNALIERATNKLLRGTNRTVIPASVTTIGPRFFRSAENDGTCYPRHRHEDRKLHYLLESIADEFENRPLSGNGGAMGASR